MLMDMQTSEKLNAGLKISYVPINWWGEVWLTFCRCITFLPHPAGGEAASRVGPKIALDHVRVYKKKLCLCALGFLTIGCIQCY